MERLENFEHKMFGELGVYGTPEKPMFNAGEVALKLWAPINDGGNIRPKMQKLNDALLINSESRSNRLRSVDFISERQLYRATFKSSSPHAIEFQEWVMDDVLPTIRRTGAFVGENSAEQMVSTYFPSLSGTEKMFFVKQLEENRILQEKITKRDEQIDELVDNFKPGTTITSALLQFNGVKQRGALAHLIAKKIIRVPTQTWRTIGGKLFLHIGYLPTGRSRDWFQIDFLDSDEPVGKTRRGDWYYSKNAMLTLTKTGMKKLYNMYKSDKLPMLATWDGEYKFTK